MGFHLNKNNVLYLIILLCSHGVYGQDVHIVEKGETLYSISKRYSLTVEQLTKLNSINDGVIKVGQKLIVSNTVSSSERAHTSQTGIYEVKKGDTWYGISRKYSINVNDLCALNGADTNSPLKTGQKIKVPAALTETVAKVDNEKVNNVPEKLPELKVTDPHSYSNKKGDASLVWPVKTQSISYVKGKVSGVILTANKGDDVTAIMSGTVMFSGSYRGFGNVVFIQSKTGHIYAYTGLDEISVSKGDYVVNGAKIGTVGKDAYTNKYQAQLMVFQNGQPIDPAKAPRG